MHMRLSAGTAPGIHLLPKEKGKPSVFSCKLDYSLALRHLINMTSLKKYNDLVIS